MNLIEDREMEDLVNKAIEDHNDLEWEDFRTVSEAQVIVDRLVKAGYRRCT